MLGRDGRESGAEIKNILIDELTKMNVEVVDGDILPTPTILLAVKIHKYDGAIIITASHNPTEYNGLKFVTKEALLTNEEQVEKMKKEVGNFGVLSSISQTEGLLKLLVDTSSSPVDEDAATRLLSRAVSYLKKGPSK